ncbi:MAG: exodeoxyribonuclease V subunit gamma [Candidatus Omnitrophica bacterium]|nr:exodeoxyribonuclease V subunit gamma [Candidatus Omnitrophota bacterium]
MSRKLLIGPAGSGKTHRILDEFQQALSRAPDPLAEDLYLILPSIEHTDRMITLLLARGLKGFFHERVTTLTHLIPRLFGVEEESVISNPARYALVRDILTKNCWDYFAEVQQSAGFLELVVQFITELKDSLISAPMFRERMNELKRYEPELAPKYEALAEIYETYEKHLADAGLRDPQDDLKIFREKKGKGDIHPAFVRKGRVKKLWLDGFFDFSGLQREYLRELAEIADDITITLTKDPAPHREKLFDIVGSTEKILTEMGFEIEVMGPAPAFRARVSPSRPRGSESTSVSYRTKKPALVFLERNLFSGSKPKKIPPAKDTISVFEAVGIQGEVEMIARQIECLHRAGGYRYSDFAILLRFIGRYESAIRSIFGRYGIPVEIHERERLKLSPMIHTVVLLLKIYRGGWNRNDLINFLKSSYVRRVGETEKNYEWVSEFENRIFRRPMPAGREDWLKDWPDEIRDKRLDDFNRQKAQVLGVVAGLEDELRNARRFSAFKHQLLDAVRRTFGMIEVSDVYRDPVLRNAASARRLEALLEEIRMRLVSQGRDRADFEEFTDQFFRLVELDLYSLHHRDKNRVQIYDVSLARQKEYRVVFVAGLLEKTFPVQIKEDPLLSDWERRLINTHLEVRLQERLPRQGLERYLFYLAVTRAQERLILTYPRLDQEGKESLASFYLDEVKSLFQDTLEQKRQDLAHPYPDFEEAVSLRELETSVIGRLWDSEVPDEKLLLYVTNRLLENPASCGRIRKAVCKIKAELTDPSIHEGDYFRTRLMSATRLEEYGRCPYRYFANRVLKLYDPEDDLNIKRQGTILHQVLENFFRARLEDGVAEAKAFILREFETALSRHPLIREKQYQWELDCEYLRETLLRFIEFELDRLSHSPLQPRYFEFNFGTDAKDAAPVFEIDGEAEKISLCGKIDRIDVDPDGRLGLVVDYKRSAEFKKDDLEFGVALQLPIYLAAMERFLKLTPIGGEFYVLRSLDRKGFYHEKNAAPFADIASQKLKFSDEEFAGIIERSFDYVRRFMRDMKRSEIPVRPRLCLSFCPFSPVCRIEKWRLPEIYEEIREEDKRLAAEETHV